MSPVDLSTTTESPSSIIFSYIFGKSPDLARICPLTSNPRRLNISSMSFQSTDSYSDRSFEPGFLSLRPQEVEDDIASSSSEIILFFIYSLNLLSSVVSGLSSLYMLNTFSQAICFLPEDTCLVFSNTWIFSMSARNL